MLTPEELAYTGWSNSLGDPMGALHAILDAAGVVDPTGTCDIINALIYASEGDYFIASLSLLAAVPVGDIVKAVKGARYVDDALGALLKLGDDAVDASKVPNPYGKLGGPAHQGKIAELADDLVSKGYEVSFEKYVKTTGGFKNARFGDIFVKNPTTGESWIINVGKGRKGGFPISREWKALEDLMNQGYTVQFVPYN